MKKVLFLDRDGTLVIEPQYNLQLDSLEKLEFYPGVFRYLSQIASELDYELVMITNQDGLGTDSFPENNFWPPHNKILQAFKNEGIQFSEVLIDRSFASDNVPTRKPGIGMLGAYLKGSYDLKHSFVIGDRSTDIELAKNLGTQAIYISKQKHDDAILSTTNWREIYEFLKGQNRKALIKRTTSETDIIIELNLDGTGRSNIKTGLGFFEHLLDQVAKHSGIDLSIMVKGDLYIDEHHTIEDVGLTLGIAIRQALGDKKGINRYGFLLPMDDCLAQIAIDFGGRPGLVWAAEFKREKIGEMPTEMLKHFFKSFSDTAQCNINIKAEGDNEHHKAEAIFKSFAKALKMAINKTNDETIPSTKGIL